MSGGNGESPIKKKSAGMIINQLLPAIIMIGVPAIILAVMGAAVWLLLAPRRDAETAARSACLSWMQSQGMQESLIAKAREDSLWELSHDFHRSEFLRLSPQ